jgi:hypothetical protein
MFRAAASKCRRAALRQIAWCREMTNAALADARMWALVRRNGVRLYGRSYPCYRAECGRHTSGEVERGSCVVVPATHPLPPGDFTGRFRSGHGPYSPVDARRERGRIIGSERLPGQNLARRGIPQRDGHTAQRPMTTETWNYNLCLVASHAPCSRLIASSASSALFIPAPLSCIGASRSGQASPRRHSSLASFPLYDR